MNFKNIPQLLALTDSNTLVSLDVNNLDESQPIEVTGVDGFLLGIDTRPANGMVYSISTNNDIYTIDPKSGEATYISTLDTPFEGGTISGFDFNPVADRLRLVGDNDQDFRINVDTGEVTVDGTLSFARGDLNEGVNPNVTAAAYTNSFDGTETTQLYDIDTLLNDLVLQDPPNDGTLQTIGDLGVNFDTLGGFDIAYSEEEGNTAFAVSNNTLYTIDLETGEANSLAIASSADYNNLQGLTAVPEEVVPIVPTINDLLDTTEMLALTDDNMLISFDHRRPSEVNEIEVKGVDGVLLGIDTRPANGMVYSISNNNDIYTIDPKSGEATYVSTLDMPFEGGTISGFDFNPAADRLRLVGDNDQDFRINVDTGEVTVDGTLSFAEGDFNEDVNPKVTAAAYTNSFDGTETTQLYDIDTKLDSLVLQDPPNDGTLQTIGELGIDFGTLGGFDILSSLDGDNVAFAASDSNLYTINLGTGEAIDLGIIGDNHYNNLQGLTVIADADYSEPQELTPVVEEVMPTVPTINDLLDTTEMLALTDDNMLISFDHRRPSEVNEIEVKGVDGVLLGIDTRPANGMVYSISNNNDIYTIDLHSGEATYVSTLDMPFEGGTISGFDFNPAADRLRLVGDNDQDFRINVDTGEVTVDGTLSFAEGDFNEDVNPKVTAAAYTNSFDGTETTQLYDIDTKLDSLVLQDPPNDGTLQTIGELGIDFGTLGGFDILSSLDGDNVAFAASDSNLYTINLGTGEAIDLGVIGDNHYNNLQGLTVVADADLGIESDWI